MKNKLLSLIGLAFLIMQGCCDNGGIPGYVATIQNALRMKSNLDTIFTITYPNSDFKITPNSFKSKMALSSANEYTTLYIFSTKGYDTIIIKIKQELSYEKTYCTSNNYLKKNIERAQIINYTFETSFFKYYEKGDYSQKEIYDTLIVD